MESADFSALGSRHLPQPAVERDSSTWLALYLIPLWAISTSAVLGCWDSVSSHCTHHTHQFFPWSLSLLLAMTLYSLGFLPDAYSSSIILSYALSSQCVLSFLVTLSNLCWWDFPSFPLASPPLPSAGFFQFLALMVTALGTFHPCSISPCFVLSTVSPGNEVKGRQHYTVNWKHGKFGGDTWSWLEIDLFLIPESRSGLIKEMLQHEVVSLLFFKEVTLFFGW